MTKRKKIKKKIVKKGWGVVNKIDGSLAVNYIQAQWEIPDIYYTRKDAMEIRNGVKAFKLIPVEVRYEVKK